MKEVTFISKCDECEWTHKNTVDGSNYEFVNAALDSVKYNRNLHRHHAGHNPGIRAYARKKRTTTS
jgi:hypothetical protein